MKCTLFTLVLLSILSGPAVIKDQGVKGTVFIDADIPIRIENAYVVLRHGPLWQDTVQTDSTGCFCFKTPYNGDHYIKAFKNFGDEKDPDIWESGWRFVVVHRDKFTTITLNLERK